jgi:DNA-directed RNA polymerase specialized sigma subunit
MADLKRFTAVMHKRAAPALGRKAQDRELWQRWQRSQSPQDLQALLDQLKPIIAREVNRWAGSLARGTLETKAKALAVKAIQSYNPAMGTTLSTHVTNQLQKLSRTIYTHTQAARLPEHKAVAMTSFSAAHDMLNSELGRAPTALELSENLGWSKIRTSEFQKAFQRKELLTSGEFRPSSFAVNDYQQDPMVDFVYHDMAPESQKLFEHVTGYGGAKVLSNKELMKKFKLTQGQLSYRKRKLIDTVKDAIGER